MNLGIYKIACLTVTTVFALAACAATDNGDTPATDEGDGTAAKRDDLIAGYTYLGCVGSEETANPLVASDPPVEAACISWTLSEDGTLQVDCVDLVSECGGAEHAAAYQTGSEVVFRTYKDPASTGECDTAACVCPNHFNFSATISPPESGFTLVIESGGCEGEKEEELARIEIPADEVVQGERCAD